MENAADALIMAGQVLIFIVALSVCISSFTTVREEVNRIIDEPETINLAKGSNGYINYIQARDNNATRVVGIETIISSMYRAIKENYVIYIKLSNPNDYNITITGIDTITATKDITKKINNTDTTYISRGDTLMKITIGEDTNQDVNSILKAAGGNFYDTLSDKNFYEFLGEYQDNNNVTTENKQTYRIITYVDVEAVWL